MSKRTTLKPFQSSPKEGILGRLKPPQAPPKEGMLRGLKPPQAPPKEGMSCWDWDDIVAFFTLLYIIILKYHTLVQDLRIH